MEKKVLTSDIDNAFDNLVKLISTYQEQDRERISIFAGNILKKDNLNAVETLNDAVHNKETETEPMGSLNIIEKVVRKREGEIVLCEELKNKLLNIKEEFKNVGSRFGESNRGA